MSMEYLNWKLPNAKSLKGSQLSGSATFRALSDSRAMCNSDLYTPFSYVPAYKPLATSWS